FGAFAAIYYWFPKMFGRMMNETLGKIHFAFTFIGFNWTFFPMHILGIGGHMRRIYDPTQYDFLKPFQPMNTFITYGAFILGAGDLRAPLRGRARHLDGLGTRGAGLAALLRHGAAAHAGRRPLRARPPARRRAGRVPDGRPRAVDGGGRAAARRARARAPRPPRRRPPGRAGRRHRALQAAARGVGDARLP